MPDQLTMEQLVQLYGARQQAGDSEAKITQDFVARGLLQPNTISAGEMIGAIRSTLATPPASAMNPAVRGGVLPEAQTLPQVRDAATGRQFLADTTAQSPLPPALEQQIRAYTVRPDEAASYLRQQGHDAFTDEGGNLYVARGNTAVPVQTSSMTSGPNLLKMGAALAASSGGLGIIPGLATAGIEEGRQYISRRKGISQTPAHGAALAEGALVGGTEAATRGALRAGASIGGISEPAFEQAFGRGVKASDIALGGTGTKEAARQLVRSSGFIQPIRGTMTAFGPPAEESILTSSGRAAQREAISLGQAAGTEPARPRPAESILAQRIAGGIENAPLTAGRQQAEQLLSQASKGPTGARLVNTRPLKDTLYNALIDPRAVEQQRLAANAKVGALIESMPDRMTFDQLDEFLREDLRGPLPEQMAEAGAPLYKQKLVTAAKLTKQYRNQAGLQALGNDSMKAAFLQASDELDAMKDLNAMIRDRYGNIRPDAARRLANVDSDPEVAQTLGKYDQYNGTNYLKRAQIIARKRQFQPIDLDVLLRDVARERMETRIGVETIARLLTKGAVPLAPLPRTLAAGGAHAFAEATGAFKSALKPAANP